MKKFTMIFLVVLVACIPENTPPNCDIIKPLDGSEYTRGESVQVYIEASDDNGTVDEVRFYLDSFGIQSVAGFPYSFELATDEMGVGRHHLKAEAIDNSGKQTEATVSFVINSELPQVETAQPVSITVDSAEVGGVILDSGGGTISSSGVIWGDRPYEGSGFQEVTTDVTDGPFSITLSNLGYDTYYVLAFAENEAGRTYGEQVSFTTLPPENTPPLCEIISPIEGSEFVLGANIEIIANVTDEEADIQQVRFYLDRIPIASRAAVPYSHTFTTEGMSLGPHSIRVEAYDNYGEQSIDSLSFSIKPQLPIVETSQPVVITNESAIVGGTILDNGGGTIVSAGVLWSNMPGDPTDFTKVPVEENNNPFSITLTGLEYAIYYVVAFAENESGRSYGEQVSFTTLLPADMFVDNRDGNAYKWVRIGNQIWMAENLAYLPEMGNPSNYTWWDPAYYVYDYMNFNPREASTTYNYNTYGVLYNYTAAHDACPDGWHLPTLEEERQLISIIGGENQVGRLMEEGTDYWNTNPDGTNETGFSARGAGWTELDHGQFGFSDMLDATGWWKVDSCATDTTMVLPFTIESYGTPVLKDSECKPMANGYSVRCVKD